MKNIKVAVTAAKNFQNYFFSPNYDRTVDDKLTKANIDRLLELYDDAGRQKMRLITSYENVTNVQVLPEFRDRVETIPGSTTERFARVARRRKLYAHLNLYEKERDQIYNTAVLIGPDGKIVGKYRKVHLPPQERQFPSAGNGFPVFETDLGKIGFSICYDIMFPESARCAALNGADIIIHSGNTSYTCREYYPRVRAAENMVWFMVCNIMNARMSEIIDPHGTVVAHSHGEAEIISAEINPLMDRELPGDNWWAGTRSLRGRMTQERVPEAYAVICKAQPPVLSRYRNDRIPSKAAEFERVYRKARQATSIVSKLALARQAALTKIKVIP